MVYNLNKNRKKTALLIASNDKYISAVDAARKEQLLNLNTSKLWDELINSLKDDATKYIYDLNDLNSANDFEELSDLDKQIINNSILDILYETVNEVAPKYQDAYNKEVRQINNHYALLLKWIANKEAINTNPSHEGWMHAGSNVFTLKGINVRPSKRIHYNTKLQGIRSLKAKFDELLDTGLITNDLYNDYVNELAGFAAEAADSFGDKDMSGYIPLTLNNLNWARKFISNRQRLFGDSDGADYLSAYHDWKSTSLLADKMHKTTNEAALWIEPMLTTAVTAGAGALTNAATAGASVGEYYDALKYGVKHGFKRSMDPIHLAFRPISQLYDVSGNLGFIGKLAEKFATRFPYHGLLVDTPFGLFNPWQAALFTTKAVNTVKPILPAMSAGIAGSFLGRTAYNYTNDISSGKFINDFKQHPLGKTFDVGLDAALLGGSFAKAVPLIANVSGHVLNTSMYNLGKAMSNTFKNIPNWRNWTLPRHLPKGYTLQINTGLPLSVTSSSYRPYGLFNSKTDAAITGLGLGIGVGSEYGIGKGIDKVLEDEDDE